MSLNISHNEDHPNKMPFSGVPPPSFPAPPWGQPFLAEKVALETLQERSPAWGDRENMILYDIRANTAFH
jgi:hypothetical protein